MVIIDETILPKNTRRYFSIISGFENNFKLLNISNYKICFSSKPRTALNIIRIFIEEQNSDFILRVYAVGGDGILFDCLNGIMILAARNSELALIPYCYTNYLAQHFGKTEINDFRIIKDQILSETIPIDVIDCASNYALSFCTIDFEAKSYMRIKNVFKMKNVFKIALSNKNLNKYYRINIDGSEITGKYQIINTKADNGVLDITFDKSSPKHFRAKEISVYADTPFLLILDGQIFIESDASFKIMPCALNFVNVKKA
ncbi:MAG: hypothetical protein Ta2G_00580 [Termitinemataceae bacterium]|nr:MAG: hypothetical protein Ta2G_00580 [Termitinemataceae bacterium]